MNLKTLLSVIGFLAVLSAVVFIAKRPSEPTATDPRVGAPLVDVAAVEKAAKIQISDQGKVITLARQPDGTWANASYFDFPADFSKLNQFVDELLKAKADRFVTANPERIARFEFKDTKVALLDEAGKELWSVTLGKNVEGGGRVIRFGNEAKAYVSRMNLWLDSEQKNWADSSLLQFKPEDIAKVEFSLRGSQPMAVKRDKKEDAFKAETLPPGMTLREEKIRGLLSTLSNLRFSDTTAPDDPKAVEPGKVQRRAKLTTFDGRSYTVTFSRKPEQKIVKAPATPKEAGPAVLAKATEAVLGDKKEAKSEPAKALEPVTETIPAGPVFVSVADSDAKATVNALMKKRAFEVFEYSLNSVPEKAEDLLQPAQPPAEAAKK